MCDELVMSPNCTDMQAPAGHQYPQAFTEGATRDGGPTARTDGDDGDG